MTLLSRYAPMLALCLSYRWWGDSYSLTSVATIRDDDWPVIQRLARFKSSIEQDGPQ